MPGQRNHSLQPQASDTLFQLRPLLAFANEYEVYARPRARQLIQNIEHRQEAFFLDQPPYSTEESTCVINAQSCSGFIAT